MNPLLQLSNLEYSAIPFDKIKAEHFLPALKESIEIAYKNKDQYIAGNEISFESCILKLEQMGELADYISTIFYSLYGAHATDEIQKISEEVSQLITKFSNNITLDDGVFKRVKSCYEKKDSLGLNKEQYEVLDAYYKSFIRNGALLDASDKEKLRGFDEKLSSLNLKFSKNVLDATNDFELLVENQKDLDGIPQNAIEEASELAKKKNKKGWIFTLQYPSYLPFISYCKNEKLREQMYRASTKKAFSDKFDNQEVLMEIVKTREARARLLGFKTHAEFVLQRRMASEPAQVLSFLDNLLIKALPTAKKEKERIAQMKKEGELNPWDVTFYSEILKKKELDLDEEELRPYFQLENVIEGVFTVANKLYGISFKPRADLPVYHEEVKVYEVSDSDGQNIGLFYTDFFPRETKRGGAWMTNLFEQGFYFDKVRRPHIAIVCNFTKPTKSSPSLLSYTEVITLFHEFGHALHGLLTKCTYRKLSGTSVYWDFVELPSQIMENWAQEKECLDLFAKHYKTGEKIPAQLVEKIKNNSKFLQGMATLRQLSFAYLDMAWHSTDSNKINDVVSFERGAMSKASLFKPLDGACMSTAFSHIFAGGYSAGYYSYKWAEVLDADAFEYFQEKGIFNPEVANKFKTNILEKGGTEHPMQLYKKFRGKEPSVNALLKRAGLA